VAFLLNIRHNIEAAKDHFGRGDIQQFPGEEITVGRGASCDCRIDDAAFTEEHFRIIFHPGKPASLIPGETGETFVNWKAATSKLHLFSGDDIRVGHWIVRFQKLYDDIQLAPRATAVAGLTKALIVLIIIAEISVVGWLPYHARSAMVWQTEIAKQRTAVLLDGLRYRQRRISPRSDFDRAVLEALGDELDARARYLRTYESNISPEQRRGISEDCRNLQGILDRIENGNLLQSMPPIDIDSGVQHILHPEIEKAQRR